MNVYLVGMPGSGKTTFGKRLAAAARLGFADLDVLLSRQEGMAVRAIFARHGEAYFREAEARALRRTALLVPGVVSTGGGTPCFSDNMAWMNAHGVTVFLDVPLPELLHRLTSVPEAQASRPLFAGQAPEQVRLTLESLHAARLPYYQQAQVRLAPHQTQPRAIAALLKEKAPQLFG